MSAIRFIEIALLLSLLVLYRFAAPRAVDYDSKTDNGKCRSNDYFNRCFNSAVTNLGFVLTLIGSSTFEMLHR